jgi:hypothetical protein
MLEEKHALCWHNNNTIKVVKMYTLLVSKSVTISFLINDHTYQKCYNLPDWLLRPCLYRTELSQIVYVKVVL